MINCNDSKGGSPNQERVVELNNYAVKWMARGELSKAEANLQQSLEQAISMTSHTAPAPATTDIQQCNHARRFHHKEHQREYNEGMDRSSQPICLSSGPIHEHLHAIVATVAYNQGLLYLRQDRYRDAEGSLQHALHYVQQNFTGSIINNTANTNIIQILHNIGFVQYKRGRIKDALNSYERAYQVLNKCKSTIKDPLCIRLCILDLASNLNCQGVVTSQLQSDESATARAVEFYNQSLAIRSELLGNDRDDKDIAITLNNLGRIYFHQGDHNKALWHYSKSLSMRIRLFGRHHLDVAASTFEVGKTHHCLGNLAVALENYEVFTSIIAKLRGEFHSDLSKGLKGIAQIRLEQKNYDEAIKIFRQALSVEKDGEKISLISNKIADILCEQGDFDGAIRVYKETMDLQCEAKGFCSFNVVDTLKRMGHVHKLRGEFNCSVHLLRTAVDIQRKLVGQFHPDVSSTLSSIALVCYETRNYKEALKVYQDVLQIQRRVFGHNHAHPAGTLRSIGHLFICTKQYEMASRCYSQSLKVYRVLDSPNDIAGILSNIASIHWNLGDHEKCIMRYSEALSTLRRALGCQRHVKLIPILKQLGSIYRSGGMLQEAIQCFTEAVEIHKMDCQENNGSEIAQILNEIANIHLQSGQTDEMMVYFFEASRHLRTSGRMEYDLPVNGLDFYHISKMYPECSSAA